MPSRPANGSFAYKDPYGDRKIKLKPCPFCGKVPKLQRYQVIKTRKMAYGVWCSNANEGSCPMLAVETLPFEHKQDAIDAWNKRA